MKKSFSLYLLCFWMLPVLTQAASQGNLSERVGQLEKKLSGQIMMEMLDRMEFLQKTVRDLRGEVDRLGHELERTQTRQQKLYLDLDKRLMSVEQGSTTGANVADPRADVQAPVVSVSGQVSQEAPTPLIVEPEVPISPPSSPAQRTAAKDSTKEGAIYQRAFVFLNNGRYDDAVSHFSLLIDSYPQGDYADNAQYWLGETYYVKREFQLAREHFTKVMENYSESIKVSDALLKTGYIEYETGQWGKARKVLKSVVEKHPDSNAALLASDRLKRMRKEGH
ncbi:MAG: tol-pal system protein YbgF [Methylococcales bacterium]|nr:tol-pal system protein YbgF [Methylococcales bacterium]